MESNLITAADRDHLSKMCSEINQSVPPLRHAVESGNDHLRRITFAVDEMITLLDEIAHRKPRSYASNEKASEGFFEIGAAPKLPDGAVDQIPDDGENQ